MNRDDDPDDFVVLRPADCSDECWAEIVRLVDERFKEVTAKAAQRLGDQISAS